MSDKTVAELMALHDRATLLHGHAMDEPNGGTVLASNEARAALEQAIRRAVDWECVGHFVQRSGFGPWIEVAAIEEGATPLYRRQDQ